MRHLVLHDLGRFIEPQNAAAAGLSRGNRLGDGLVERDSVTDANSGAPALLASQKEGRALSLLAAAFDDADPRVCTLGRHDASFLLDLFQGKR